MIPWTEVVCSSQLPLACPVRDLAFLTQTDGVLLKALNGSVRKFIPHQAKGHKAETDLECPPAVNGNNDDKAPRNPKKYNLYNPPFLLVCIFLLLFKLISSEIT